MIRTLRLACLGLVVARRRWLSMLRCWPMSTRRLWSSPSRTVSKDCAQVHCAIIKSFWRNFTLSMNRFLFILGVEHGDFQAFLWEKFTTKPWFDNQDLRCLGEVPTPWPAFVFVSSDSLSTEKAAAIRDCLFPALYEGLSIFLQEALDDPSPVAGMLRAPTQY